jgi:hypothetical protein
LVSVLFNFKQRNQLINGRCNTARMIIYIGLKVKYSIVYCTTTKSWDIINIANYKTALNINANKMIYMNYTD